MGTVKFSHLNRFCKTFGNGDRVILLDICIYIQTDGIILRSSVANERLESVEEVPRWSWKPANIFFVCSVTECVLSSILRDRSCTFWVSSFENCRWNHMPGAWPRLESGAACQKVNSVEEVPSVFPDLFRFRFADCLIEFLRSLVARFLYFFLIYFNEISHWCLLSPSWWVLTDFSIISLLNKEFPAIWLVERFLIWRYINRSRRHRCQLGE